MRKFTLQAPVLMLASGLLVPLACSAGNDQAKPSGQPESSDVSPEDLRAKIISVDLGGELCPPSPTSTDGLPDNVTLAANGDSVSLWSPSADFADYLTQSSNPSCTITVEAEVPPGFQMGAPRATWRGNVAGSPDAVTVTRTYSFENGDSASAEPRTNLDKDFILVDSDLPAFSPSCSAQRVRLTARIEAQIADSASRVALDSATLMLGWRLGTAFKKGCSPGEPVEATRAAKGDWCGGPQRRLCEPDLSCEYRGSAQRQDEGTCVDTSVTPPPAKLREGCDGPRKIPCESGMVCWHPDQDAIERNLLGWCRENRAGIDDQGIGDDCRTGVPALECQAGLYCAEEAHRCVRAEGREFDRCGPELPKCASPLYCSPGTDDGQGTCWRAQGLTGQPCGSLDYPDCASPRYCQDQVCVEPRSLVGGPCGEGTPGCQEDYACVDNVCVLKR